MSEVGDGTVQWWERRPNNKNHPYPAALRRVHEAASWSLAAALCRRRPGEFHIIHGRPEAAGGGDYDCLFIISASIGTHIEINREGTGSGRGTGGASWPGLLDRWMLDADRDVLIDELLGALLVSGPNAEGQSNLKDWTYTVIASLLAKRASEPYHVWSVGGLREIAGVGLRLDGDLAKVLGIPVEVAPMLPPRELVLLPEASIYSMRRSGRCVATITTDALATVVATGEVTNLFAVAHGDVPAAHDALVEAIDRGDEEPNRDV